MITKSATRTIFPMLLSLWAVVICAETISIIPKAVSDLISVGQYISSDSGFDFPKVAPINSSSYDWWWFDTVSEDGKYSTSAAFIAAPETAFVSGLPDTDMLLGVVFLSTPDEPLSTVYQLLAEEAVLVSDGDGVRGDWNGTGMQFFVSPDLGTAQVDIDMPSLGLTGSIILKSRAPAHYPSGPARGGLSMEVLPGVGWANAIPDADAEVAYVVNGTEVKFQGVGYHDKNWGTSYFLDHVQSWYWAHGRLGPYSIVVWDGITPTGEEHVSAYVAKDGDILFARNSSVAIRPTGTNITYPPTRGDLPTGFTVNIDMGCAGVLDIDIALSVTADESAFGEVRWVGQMKGGIRGETNYTGPAALEQYAF